MLFLHSVHQQITFSTMFLIHRKAPMDREVKVSQVLSELASTLRNMKCKSNKRPVAGKVQSRRGGRADLRMC